MGLFCRVPDAPFALPHGSCQTHEKGVPSLVAYGDCALPGVKQLEAVGFVAANGR